MRALLLAVAVFGLSGCDDLDRQKIVASACRIAGNPRYTGRCPLWTLVIGKIPIAAFWGYKDSEQNRKTCLKAREVEPNSECYPVMDF